MRTIRRSGARDLPPSADRVMPVVIVTPPHPSPGEVVSIMSYAGIPLRVKVSEISLDDTGWVGWGDVLPGNERALREAGVPDCGSSTRMRIFDWQLLQ